MKFLLILFLCTQSILALDLKLNNHILYSQDFSVDGKAFGGLSGVRFNEKTNELLAVSDDRSKLAAARFYKFKTEIKDGKVNITPSHMVYLKNSKEADYKKNTIDFEDIEILKNGNLLITSEGSLRGKTIYPPRIITFSSEGKYINDLMIDEKFTPLRDNGYFTRGVRDNLAFEPISISPSGEYMFFSTEDALVQDSEVATLKAPSTIRISKYKSTGTTFVPMSEYAYSLGPIESLESIMTSTGAQSGVPAILSLDDNTLLVAERTYYPIVDKTKILLFKVTIDEKVTDVSTIKSLKGAKLSHLKKQIVADLDNYIKDLNSEYQFLDNIEGMCFGPTLPNGNKTLIFVSDNNFSKYQRTHFLVFEVK
ncbi:esterase-like activity of phytase family protein [Bacteriovorax sp. Seq25_V]|uniref:esterase-like activity of phytase family protein n=1 Tax=Bacteriovorax sp. Seq25_V TaxID=1201288 RepID=UPI00038A0611|nr:esterase-like activity of phytase family protein [Bacteriovorax sp. Seq25_V]EQC47523.1 phytase esterase-like protein [Bacteriovorax sp. Seq25_V]